MAHFGSIWSLLAKEVCKYLVKVSQAMASTKFYLDHRNVSDGCECPLKIAIFTAQNTSFINLGVKLLPKQWDKANFRVVNHPQKDALNLLLNQRKQEIDMLIFEYTKSGRTELTAKEIKDLILARDKEGTEKKVPKNAFVPYFERFIQRYKGRTYDLYKCTLKKVITYVGMQKVESLVFEDINKEWLYGLDDFLAQTSPSQNARNIHFRNIRAVFNDAIDEEVTVHYPFRKFKIKPVRTRKRSFKVEVLRKIFNTPIDGFEEKYRDIFKLIFCLCGINIVDLCNLKSMEDGRIEYDRAKTSRHYSIKVEPEAMAIIEKYRGKDWLINPLDTNKNYRCYYMRLCHGLKTLKETLNAIDDGIKIDELTTYWARHSWATVAASLDIPKETIAAALGHGGNTVTDIYIDFDQKKVDEANRKVLDYVFGAPEKKKRGRPRKA